MLKGKILIIRPYIRSNSGKFENFSFQPKYTIFEGKSQKLGWIPSNFHPVIF